MKTGKYNVEIPDDYNQVFLGDVQKDDQIYIPKDGGSWRMADESDYHMDVVNFICVIRRES